MEGIIPEVLREEDESFNYNEPILVEDRLRRPKAVSVRAAGGVSNKLGPWTFSLETYANKYILLNDARLEIRWKITRADGSPLVSYRDIVAPLTGLGQSWCKMIELILNGRTFPGSVQDNIAYKSYLETLASNSPTDGRNDQLKPRMWYQDTPGRHGQMGISEITMKEAFIHAVEVGEVNRPVIPALLEADPARDTLWEDVAGITMRPIDADNFAFLPADSALEREHKKLRRRQKLYQDLYTVNTAGSAHVLEDGELPNLGFEKRFSRVIGSNEFDTYSPSK